MTRSSGWTPGFLAITLSLALAGGAAAQQPPERDRAQMEERFRAQMTRVIKERLELTDEQSEALSALAQEFERRRRQLFREEQATRRRMEALLLEGGDDAVEAQELLERVLELRREELALFEEEQAALLEVLPANKVLQLQSLREEMGRRIRSLRRGDGPRRRGGPPGRGPGDTAASAPGNVDGRHGVPLFGIPPG